ncbi:MAG: GGDEF domain-containing protein, partial [Rhodospirillales bacterium]|nr:GGDEF domain-containing protein [Rhodospirillales bacterium]
SSDVVARLGGDEFTVILSDPSTLGDACTVAETIIGAVSRPYPIGGSVLKISASIGIAFHPDDGDSDDELIRKADAAMYKAKAGGKCGWRVGA